MPTPSIRVSYALTRDNFPLMDTKLAKYLYGSKRGDSGAGFGERDIEFEYPTWKAASAGVGQIMKLAKTEKALTSVQLLDGQSTVVLLNTEKPMGADG